MKKSRIRIFSGPNFFNNARLKTRPDEPARLANWLKVGLKIYHFSILLRKHPPHCESISNPKNGDLYLHYSNDKAKLSDCKADGMCWDNKGQKALNVKANPLYRSLYHL